MNLLPWFVRSRAGLRAIRHQADGGHCPCPRWSCTAFRWASEGRCRPYLPVTRECATDAAGGLFLCHYAHTAAKALHRLCASSPGSAWAFQSLSVLGSECGFRWTLQEPHSPQIFRSSLAAFPVRSSLIPIGGALCRFYALCGGVAG